MTHAVRLLGAGLLMAGVLAACADGDGAQTPQQRAAETGESTLPAPAGAAGSVTGMPNAPSAISAGATPALPPDTPISSTDAATGVLVADAATPLSGSGNGPEPGTAEAVVQVRNYHAALNARDYARALQSWSQAARDSGRADAFVEGLGAPQGISVEIGQPGALDDSHAGLRSVEIPVSLVLNWPDGRLRRLDGQYWLERSLDSSADGSWKIVASDVSEVGP
ncbi:MAG TPA: hypothetical protein VNI56_05210 [Xanthomonadaceae bacterium]|nr:hypothetical protein [Xanthomonadaceae bacterium]